MQTCSAARWSRSKARVALLVTESGVSSRSWAISRMAGVLAGRVAMCRATLVQSIRGPGSVVFAGDDGIAALTRPEVVVFCAVVVVEVELGDAGLEELEGFVDADVFLGVRECAWPRSRQTPTRSKWPTRRISRMCSGVVISFWRFSMRMLYAEGMGEGLEMFDCGEGVFEGAGVPGVVLLAEVKDAGVDGDLFGGLEGALDLVHGGDAVGFFGVDEIDVGGDVAGPLAAAAVAEVNEAGEGWRRRRCCGTRWRCRGRRRGRCSRSDGERRRSQ